MGQQRDAPVCDRRWRATLDQAFPWWEFSARHPARFCFERTRLGHWCNRLPCSVLTQDGGRWKDVDSHSIYDLVAEATARDHCGKAPMSRTIRVPLCSLYAEMVA